MGGFRGRLLAALYFGGSAYLAIAAPNDDRSVPRYTVIVERQGAPVARVNLAIPKAGPRPLVLFSRAAKMGISLQAHAVRCDGHELTAVSGEWQLPSNCESVTWSVPFLDPWPEGIQGGEQQSILMPGGWLIFSDPSSLLRLKPEPSDRSVISFGGKGIRGETHELKSTRSAPAFFVLGDAPRWTVRDGALKLTYIADDLQAVKAVVDPGQHLKGLAYFKRVMGSFANQVEEVKVVWIPIAGDTHGGAAGYNMFLVNYALEPSPENRKKPLITMLHEQFHQIDGGRRKPTWVGESLAQYYALKTALNVSDNDPDVTILWNRWFEKAEKDQGKLLEVQRQVKAGDRSRYGVFYSRGSMFWRDIDSALKHAGRREGLDEILPVILGSDFPPDGSLPADVKAAFGAIPPGELERLIKKYL